MKQAHARQTLIDASVANYSNCLETEDDFRDNVVRNGFKGFNNFTDSQLIAHVIECGLHEQDDEVQEAVETLQAEPLDMNVQHARERIVKALVDYEIECTHWDGAYLSEVFRNGCEGYLDYTNGELIDEAYSLGLEGQCQVALSVLEAAIQS